MAEHDEDVAVEKVVAGCRVLGAGDYGDPVWGHVSLRDPAARGLWMKAGPRGFDEVGAADVVLIDLDGDRLAGEGSVPFEYPIHTEVLRARPDVGSVVHCHAPFSIALAATGQDLIAFSNGAGPFSGGVPRFEQPIGLIRTRELGEALAQTLGSARALFLVGHGLVAVGSSVETAVAATVLLERAAELQLLAAAAGGVAPELRHPGDRYAHTQSDAYLLRTWDHLDRKVKAAR
ncbi:MAG: class II aldolase/adducin family protein [Microbacterium sp.]|uniref:class II aldolase/adducin family protein n=1 Tax=Microbacterium sp. TaxID=51671 RepID=UPI0039E3F3ED